MQLWRLALDSRQSQPPWSFPVPRDFKPSMLARSAAVALAFIYSFDAVAAVVPAPSITLEASPRNSEPTWRQRHDKILVAARRETPDVILLGDSITQGWEFVDVWQKSFPDYKALNAGIASDRVEHVLWRVKNGELAGATHVKAVIILCGINNLAVATSDQIAATVATLIDEVRLRAPDAVIILNAVFPSGATPDNIRRGKIRAVNALLTKLGDGDRIRFIDAGPAFLEKDGSIAKTTMFDFLHLTRKGYSIWAETLKPELERAMRIFPVRENAKARTSASAPTSG